MSKAIALVGEPDQALRHLMKRVLLRAGYEVFDVANALQLEVCLRAIPLLVAPSVLLVLASKLAGPAAPSLSAAASKRSQLGLPDLQLVLTYERGSLASEPALALGACHTVGVLVAPFDFAALHAIGLRCRAVAAADGSKNASA